MSQTSDNPISIQGVLRHLVGLDYWLNAAATSRARYDDAAILATVPAVLRRFERDTLVSLTPRQVITFNDGTYANVALAFGAGGTATNGLRIKWEDAYPYYPKDAEEYLAVPLKTRPVWNVQRCRIMLGSRDILDLPPQWFVVDAHSGRFQIIPVSGTMYGSSLTAGYALLQMGFGSSQYVPHSLHFDYVAGLNGILTDPVTQAVTYGGWWADPDYSDLLRVVEEYVALQVLNDIAHVADAGLSGKSVSGGGSGESYSYTRFMDRKAELQKDIDAFTSTFGDQESPIQVAGL